MTENNSGIIISGGTANIDNLANGQNATIHVVTNTGGGEAIDTQQLMKMFDSLIAAIQAAHEPVPEKEYTISTVKMLKEEIRREKPDKSMMAKFGETILNNLKYVKDLTPIAHTLWHHIQPLIS